VEGHGPTGRSMLQDQFLGRSLEPESRAPLPEAGQKGRRVLSSSTNAGRNTKNANVRRCRNLKKKEGRSEGGAQEEGRA